MICHQPDILPAFCKLLGLVKPCFVIFERIKMLLLGPFETNQTCLKRLLKFGNYIGIPNISNPPFSPTKRIFSVSNLTSVQLAYLTLLKKHYLFSVPY